MKKRFILFLIAAAIFVLSGCGIAPAAQEVEGIVYDDPQIDMVIYMGGGYWEYEKNDQEGQVYFYKPEDPSGRDVISISSMEIGDDLESQVTYVWNFFKQQIADLSGTETGYTDITAGKYKGNELDFTIEENNVTIEGRYIVWNTGKRIYICSATTSESGKEQVDAAVGTILENFKTYDEAKENSKT